MRYINIGDLVIRIDLQEVNYEVIAMAKWDKDIRKYIASLYIKRYDIEQFDLMKEYEIITFAAGRRNIKPTITHFVENEYRKGKLQYYIDRYEYYLKCFDKGNDYFENNGFQHRG